MADPHYHHQQFTSNTQQQQQLQRSMSSGLARYQSAPSSYFASIIDSSIDDFMENCNEFVTSHPSTPQPEGPSSHELRGIEQNSSVNNSQQSQPTMPNRSLPMSNPATDGMYLPQMNIGGGRNTNLIRQSSSPANFFSNFDIEDYDVSKSTGNFGPDKAANLEALIPSPNSLKSQLDFPSGLPSSLGIMAPISEIENKNMEISGTGFPFSSWDDSDIFSDGLLKGLEDDESKTFPGMNASENQNNEVGNHRHLTMLSHHLSLPKTSAMEKFLQHRDSVPYKIRAKRGCATHPRSIAERVRRTRISERMRKLQDLVPNMDKQTNTTDMLDLAVDYIKDLQNQLQTLSENRANCTCRNQQMQ